MRHSLSALTAISLLIGMTLPLYAQVTPPVTPSLNPLSPPPNNSVVLAPPSANGLIRQSLLPLNAVNPTPQTNPSGSGFPGTRGSNQLVIYDANLGQPTTGTNEFGYEVTVRDGRVVAQEGANSTIPTGGLIDTNMSFVLSGHGKARTWLLKNAPIGSRIERQNDTIISTIDRDTYLIQLDSVVSKINKLNKTSLPVSLRKKILAVRSTGLQQTDDAVAAEATELQKELIPYLWKSYPAVPTSATKAIWHRPSEKSVAAIRQSLDKMQKAGINTIFLESYLHGDPIFPSTTFKTYHIPQRLPFPLTGTPNDPLQTWLSEAHQRGMKVHAWFQTFYAGNLQYDRSMGSILKTYPQWVNLQRSGLDKPTVPPSTLEPGGYFLDPANPEVQKFLLTLIGEMVTRYPLDGFQLDYIRYPSSFPPDRYSYVATTWGYTPTARAAFQAQTTADPVTLSPKDSPALWNTWNDYKTQQVNNFVHQAHDLIHQKRPAMPVSVAIFPKINDALSRKHQNWVFWAKQNWVDFIAPMTLTSSINTIAEDTRLVKDQTHLPVVTGIFGPFNGNNASDVVEQVWTAFSNGAVGTALFDTAHLTVPMVDALEAGIFKPSGKTGNKLEKP